jgi:predicted O-methyltransferase YrrM
MTSGSSLHTAPVTEVLARIYEGGDERDRAAKRRLARASERGELAPEVRAALMREAPLAITPGVGELLYALALSRPRPTIVEFGASLGVSTIYLAAALRDGGGGSLISTELDPAKAQVASMNLLAAGLDGLAQIRVGDARQTLSDLQGPVDLLVLDGFNDLYLDVLRVVQPLLVGGGLVVADLSKDDPNLLGYLDHVRDPAHGYFSTLLALDAGVELSVRMAQEGVDERREIGTPGSSPVG